MESRSVGSPFSRLGASSFAFRDPPPRHRRDRVDPRRRAGPPAAATPAIERRGITPARVAVTNLAGRGFGAQLELPLDRPLDAALDAAIDEVRDRYGPDAIRRGDSPARNPDLSPWLRPGEEARAYRRRSFGLRRVGVSCAR